MGFSPGDFDTTFAKTFHWELKDEMRIVLWTENELGQLLSMNLKNAKKCYKQLQLLIRMCDPDWE